MAKIALLARRLTPQALGLAQALKFHRHEITLITSALEPVPDDLGFQVLTYFKRWSAFEALRFFPRILGQAPEVWHFVFADNQQEKPTPAHWVLAQMARALPGRVVAASFYDSLFHSHPARFVPLLKSCDIVTTATRENLMFLKRKSWMQTFVETEVLPPFQMMEKSESEKAVDPDLRQLLEAARPYLVIPSERLPAGDWEPILNRVQLIVCGDRPDRSLKGEYYVGAHLKANFFHDILEGSLGLVTAFDEFSPMELLRFQRFVTTTETPIVANLRQAEALPGLCVHKRSGFLIQDLQQLHQLLQDNPRLDLTSPLFESVKTDLTDSALNELNRLYMKVRHQKTSQIDFKRGPLP